MQCVVLLLRWYELLLTLIYAHPYTLLIQVRIPQRLTAMQCMLQWRAVCLPMHSSSSSSSVLSDAAPWPQMELQRLTALVDLLGRRFEPIAVLMPGRSAQQCKTTYSNTSATAAAAASAASAGTDFSCMSIDWSL
jgi:hypothetical protein